MEVSVTVSGKHAVPANEHFDAVLYLPYSNRRSNPFSSDLQALVEAAGEGDFVIKPEFPAWARDPKAEEAAKIKGVFIVRENEVFNPNCIVFNREELLLKELVVFRDIHAARTIHFLLPITWRSIPRELLVHLIHRLTLQGFKIKIAGVNS